MTQPVVTPEQAYARAKQRVEAIRDEMVRRVVRFMRACGTKTIDYPPELAAELLQCCGAVLDVEADLRRDLGAPPFAYDWLTLGEMCGRGGGNKLPSGIMSAVKREGDENIVDTVPHPDRGKKHNS